MRALPGRRRQEEPDPDGLFEQVLDGLGIDYPHHFHGWAKMLCLFHSESQPSMTINVEEGAWKCHSCGSQGHDVYAFLMAYESLTFPQAKARLKELTGHERGDSGPGVKKSERVTSGGWRPRFKLN